jgi:hypothetical protein
MIAIPGWRRGATVEMTVLLGVTELLSPGLSSWSITGERIRARPERFSRDTYLDREHRKGSLAMTLSALLVLLATLPILIATSGNAETIESPEVHRDGTVTFRLFMPSAQKVEVHLDGISGMTSTTMTKEATGVWSVTTKPLTPDIYAYLFSVDGQEIVDPNVRAYVPNYFEQGGLFTVRGSPAAVWEQTDVPHGAVSRHFYSSKITGDQRDYYVYTPPDFDPRSRRAYPVLYLLHGYSDYSDGWITMGRANFILDNLIAQGKAMPMIVVMPSGYSVPALLEHGEDGPKTPLWRLNLERFPHVLLEEVVPLVERTYPVRKDRNSRAVAGLSMGGGEAIYSGLHHMDQFAWIGADERRRAR